MTTRAAFQFFQEKIHAIYDDGEARSLARIVFEDVFQTKNFQSDGPFSIENQSKLNQLISRLLTNEPLQYILGEADFFGFKFRVNPSVLIPRQETEELVAAALRFLSQLPENQEVRALDIGTGSGCIPIVLKKKMPRLEVWAIEKSHAALDVAAENAARHFTPIRFEQMDFLETQNWSQLPDFQAIISNPPYIPTAEKRLMSPRVLDFEPPEALFVKNEEPLIFYKNIASFAAEKLEKGGALFLECNEFNAHEVLQLVENQGFTSAELINDLAGKERIVQAIL